MLKCKHLLDNNLYAVKIIENSLHNSTLEKNICLNEVHALASLSLSDANHIVRYYSAWIEENNLYIAMECCENNLRSLKLTKEKQIISVLRDMLRALSSLHSSNIVHLDIKPDNILMNGGEYKLGDLGLSRIAKRSKGEEVIEGDSRYLAWEILNEASIEKLPDLTKADIFSLGISLYELIICLLFIYIVR